MTKSELIDSIAVKYPHLHVRDVRKLVDIVFYKISEALIAGDRTEIRGFGSLSIRDRVANKARNPKTNKTVLLDKRKVVYFRMGKDFFAKLNPSNTN